MKNIVNAEKDILENILTRLDENRNKIISLLEKILKKKITNIEFCERQTLNTIEEYQFSIFKINVVYNKKEKSEIYLKMTKGGKIKESVFCFWNFIYEQYVKENKIETENIPRKAIITQKTSNKNENSILITLNQKYNYCAEVNLIELKKYTEKNPELERWVEELGIKSEDILFIGKKHIEKN